MKCKLINVDSLIVLTHYSRFGWDWNFGFMPYGSAWRTRRRIFYHCFNENVLKKYHESITQHVQAFLRRTASSAGTPECINLQLYVVRLEGYRGNDADYYID